MIFCFDLSLYSISEITEENECLFELKIEPHGYTRLGGLAIFLSMMALSVSWVLRVNRSFSLEEIAILIASLTIGFMGLLTYGVKIYLEVHPSPIFLSKRFLDRYTLKKRRIPLYQIIKNNHNTLYTKDEEIAFVLPEFEDRKRLEAFIHKNKELYLPNC